MQQKGFGLSNRQLAQKLPDVGKRTLLQTSVPSSQHTHNAGHRRIPKSEARGAHSPVHLRRLLAQSKWYPGKKLAIG